MNAIKNEVPNEYPYVDEENQLVYFNENTIINRFIDVSWHGSNKGHYISCGYNYTKMKDVLTIDVQDLRKGSHTKIIATCPVCDKIRSASFRDIMKIGNSKCFGCAKIIDLTGQSFYELTVIECAGKNDHNTYLWLCECSCGKIRTITGHSLKRGRTTSCGCRHSKIMSEFMSSDNSPNHDRKGENHHWWNPDLTDEERNEKRGGEDIQWSYDVKEKDKFTCQCCGDDRGGNLVSHHLNNYKDHPDLRTTLENGVTLCKDCHKDFHIGYMGDNKNTCTRSDFISFLQSRYPTAPFLVPSSH